jgi:hypothetical protein
MLFRPVAAVALGALVLLAASPLAAASATKPKPVPTLPPLKTITHVRTSPLCSGLRRVIGPAIGDVLQNDKAIATSKPLFHQYVQAVASGMNPSAQDLAVSRLESLIGPMVKNTKEIDKLLHDPYAFPKVAYSDGDQKLLQMRAQLLAVNEQQKKALDLISGFVDTQQLGELQASGHEYDSALSSNPKKTGAVGPTPTPLPNDVLNAGVSKDGDPAYAHDPRFQNTGMSSANPLNAFEQMMGYYQQDIAGSEQVAAKSVIAAVPLCGGHVPGSAPSPSPSP